MFLLMYGGSLVLTSRATILALDTGVLETAQSDPSNFLALQILTRPYYSILASAQEKYQVVSTCNILKT